MRPTTLRTFSKATKGPRPTCGTAPTTRLKGSEQAVARFSDEMRAALTAAYEEAVTRRLAVSVALVAAVPRGGLAPLKAIERLDASALY